MNPVIASEIADSSAAVWWAAASAAASLSTPMRKSSIAITSAWVRIADDSTLNDDASGTASTKDPRPCWVSTRPSARSRVTASRTTVRETAYSSISSASEGSLAPGARSPARILSLRPATTRAERVELTPRR